MSDWFKAGERMFWQRERLPVTTAKIVEVCDEWATVSKGDVHVYGLIVPAIAQWETREAVVAIHGTTLLYSVLSWWDGHYLFCNKEAFEQLQPFAAKEFSNRRPVIYFR